MENHLLMGKSTISMAIFNSYVSLPEGISGLYPHPSSKLDDLPGTIFFNGHSTANFSKGNDKQPLGYDNSPLDRFQTWKKH